MLMSGIGNTKRMSLHWSLSPNYNFPRVRNCMKRDEFYLLYTRHLRLRKSPSKDFLALAEVSAVEEVKLVSFHTVSYAREVVVGRKTPV